MYAALVGFILGLLARIKNQNHEHSQHHSNTTTDKQCNYPSVIPARVQVSYSEEDQKERRTYHEQYYALQKSLKRAAWLTFWGVFIYAGITLAVWHATKKAADAAKISADAANISAKVSSQQIRMQRRELELNSLVAQLSNGGAPLDATIAVYALQSPQTSVVVQFLPFIDPKTKKIRTRSNLKLQVTFDFRASKPEPDEIPQAQIGANQIARCADTAVQECIFSLPQRELPSASYEAYKSDKMKLYIWGHAAYVDALTVESYDFCKYVSVDQLNAGTPRNPKPADFLVNTAAFADCER
jgi:hypothetical protein